MWVISSRYHLNITHISSTFHPGIIQISPMHNIQISSTYYPDITHISSKYHQHIVQISPGQYFLKPSNLVKSRVLTPYMARLLPVKTPLLNSMKTPLLIIQILPNYHPEIIQKSSRYHPEIIQISSW